MKIKEIHKDLKKKVNIAEKERKSKRWQKTWYDLRTLKKLKLTIRNLKDSNQSINFYVKKNIDQNTRVMFANFGKEESVYCLDLLKQLRENNISSELYPSTAKMKKQMSYADKKSVEFVIMIGENEMEYNTITIKNMKLGTHEESTITEFISKIK